LLAEAIGRPRGVVDQVLEQAGRVSDVIGDQSATSVRVGVADPVAAR